MFIGEQSLHSIFHFQNRVKAVIFDILLPMLLDKESKLWLGNE